jgi:formylmethanofuran dehydrogenase subunit E
MFEEEVEELVICAKCGDEFEDYGDIAFTKDGKALCSPCGWGCHPDQIEFQFD